MNFDGWVRNDGPVALRTEELLKSASGEHDPILPPTFMRVQRSRPESPYVIDRDGDKNICLIDGVASQANRAEEIFKTEDCAGLVPNHEVEYDADCIKSFIDAPHRIGDSMIRYSEWRGEADAALLAFRDRGNAEPVVRLAPLSLLFGFYDGRGTGVKSQRLIRSTIYARDVDELHYRGQYVPPVDYAALGLIEKMAEPAEEEDENGDEEKAKKRKKTEEEEAVAARRKAASEIGLLSSPTHKLTTRGGVLVHGDIRRTTTLDFVSLRKLRAGDENTTRQLRDYLLGLALVAVTYPHAYALRQGCLLWRASVSQTLVMRDGEEQMPPLKFEEALEFAKQAAKTWGVAAGRRQAFLKEHSDEDLGKTKAERKKERKLSRASRAKASRPANGDESEE